MEEKRLIPRSSWGKLKHVAFAKYAFVVCNQDWSNLGQVLHKEDSSCWHEFFYVYFCCRKVLIFKTSLKVHDEFQIINGVTCIRSSLRFCTYAIVSFEAKAAVFFVYHRCCPYRLSLLDHLQPYGLAHLPSDPTVLDLVHINFIVI